MTISKMPSLNDNTILEVKNLSIGYTNKTKPLVIASDINFKLQKGQLIGLVGGNGIGKSTLLRTLTNMQPALSGSVVINQTNINNFTPLALAKQLSIVLTEPLSTKNLLVHELVALGRQPYTNWVGKLTQKDVAKVNEALKLVNIVELKDNRCFELSDGQLQKVMLARALAQDTDIIVLDEPTTHLDMYHKAYILKLLQTLTKETGKTILFSSHEIDLTIQLCNTLIVMQKNRVSYGDPCQLISEGIFESLFPSDLINFDSTSGQFKVNK